jgi:hypothetical protein
VALAAIVVFGVLATGAAHDHAEDTPGTQALHCLAVAGPIVASVDAAGTRIAHDAPVFAVELDAPAIAVESGATRSCRARDPPAGVRTA